jgi:hypothetical protein
MDTAAARRGCNSRRRNPAVCRQARECAVGGRRFAAAGGGRLPEDASPGAAGPKRGDRGRPGRVSGHRRRRSRAVRGHAAGRQPRRGARVGTRGPRAAGDRQRARFTVTRDASRVSQSRIQLQVGRGRTLPALQFREVPSATGNRASWPPNQCGRPISDDRLDVELALLACHWFGQSVLAPADRS